MALPRFSFARPAFVPEWCAIVLLALLEMVWAYAIGFHLLIGIGALLVPPGLFLLIALLRGIGRERVALFFEYAALLLGLRRCGPLFFWSFAGLNLLMLFTIPFIGGHYLTDMIAGAGVFAAVLRIVTLMERKASVANASPESAAGYGGACSAALRSR